MTVSSTAQNCIECGLDLVERQRLYCSGTCRRRAQTRRYRERVREGATVPRSTVVEQLAQQLAVGERRETNVQELIDARRALAEAGERQRNDALIRTELRKTIAELTADIRSLSSELVAVATAVVIVLERADALDVLPPTLQKRMSKWVQEDRNPWV